MNTSHVKGLPVVGIGTGERLGTVVEILLDQGADRIVAFTVDSGGGGFLSGQSARISRVAASDVRSIGPDAMTVQDATALHDSEGDDDTLALSAIMGEKMVTEGGTYIGQVTSAEIDEQAMTISSLEVSAGFFKTNRLVDKADFITIGDELIIVSDAVRAEADEPEEEAEPTVVTEDVRSAKRARR